MTAAQEEANQKLKESIKTKSKTYLTGLAGSGKSYLCEKLVNDFKEDSLVLNLKNFDGEFAPDIYAYLLSQIEQNFQDSFIETFYNISRVREILEQLKLENDVNHKDLEEYLLIRDNYSNFHFDDNFLDNYFEGIEDKTKSKFLRNINQISFESFLVDLYSLFLKEKLDSKLKVIIVIDDNDNIIDYLEKNFFKSFDEFMKLQKFQFYDYDEIREAGISDIVDFKLLISTRKNIENEAIKLDLPDDTEAQKILLDQGFNPDELEQLLALTKNNLHILSQINLDERVEEHLVYSEFLKHLFKYLNDKEIFLISSLSFFDKFDENGLKMLQYELYPEIDFSYLRTRTEYFINNDEFLEINPYYSFFIKKTVKLTDKEFESEINEVLSNYTCVLPIIEKYGKDNFELIRHLAYFDRFNSSEILFKLFDSSFKNDIKKLQQSDIIVKDSYNYKVQDDLLSYLRKFNEVVDKSEYKAKIDVIKKLWDEQTKNLQTAKNVYASELNQIMKDAKTIGQEIIDYEEKIEKIKNDKTETSDLLSNINQKYSQFQHKQPVKITLGLLSLSVVSFIIGIIGEFFLDDNIIYLILVGLSLVIFAYNYLPLRKILLRKKKKSVIEKYKNDISKLETHLDELSQNTEIIKADLVASSHKLKEIEKDIEIYEKDLNIIEMKLKEPFLN